MNKESIAAVANTVRLLTMDAVEKAKSGHPGLPMGCAELGALLYGEILSHDPTDPQWANRDRFVLSAGHGCMLLYSLLHLSGYGLTLDDLKSFRQMDSRTPGHPEWGVTPGVEATAGPLGQGFGNAVGMAVAETILAAKFNAGGRKIVDHYTYVLTGDGDMMEGVTSEAASLAAHLGLGKLIAFYDSNRITIEGSTDLAFSEDVAGRFRAYGWHVAKGGMYDLDGILSMVAEAKKAADRPSLIVLESVIGKGAPTMKGTSEVHGAPLGAEEIRKARKEMGVPEDAAFHVLPEAARYFAGKLSSWKARREDWRKTFASWKSENPALAREWTRWMETPALDLSGVSWPEWKAGEALATRAASGKVLNAIAGTVPNLFGGSADLAPSNNTNLKDGGHFRRGESLGRNFHFGIREHAMGAVVNGMAYHGGIRPFCATFMVFSDYMRGAIRVAAIAKLPVIYVFTHDSIFVGEDGPTHEPVEHIAALRVMPNLMVLRPGDAEETAAAWRLAYARTDGPTVLALTRQNLPVYPKQDADWRRRFADGAYVVKDCAGDPEAVLIATGSEVHLALKTAEDLKDRRIRVVSMPCREAFLRLPEAARLALVPARAKKVVIEAGVSFGWKGPFDTDVTTVSIDRFGESGPWQKLAERFGINAAHLTETVEKIL